MNAIISNAHLNTHLINIRFRLVAIANENRIDDLSLSHQGMSNLGEGRGNFSDRSAGRFAHHGGELEKTPTPP